MIALFRLFFCERVSSLRIEKIFNNNVAQTEDDQGNQFVIMGKGIAFGMKPGLKVDEEKIEKIYVLQDQEFNFLNIWKQFNHEEIELINQIIKYGEEKLNQTLPQTLLYTLGDYIHFAIQRDRENISLTNPLSWQIRRLFPTEYQIGRYAVQLINKRLQTSLLDSEATSIALHFVTAQNEGQMVEYTMKSVEMIEHIVSIIELKVGHAFDKQSTAFNRFITHLQYFAERVLTKQTSIESDDEFLYDQVQKNYPKAFQLSQKVNQYIKEQYNYIVGKEELVYLTIHINRILS